MQLFSDPGMLETSIVVGPGNDELDGFCRSQSDTLIYGTSRYISLISQETASEPYWIVASQGPVIRAALPLLLKRGRLGVVVNSLAYYGSNGGVIAAADDLEATRGVLSRFVRFCDELNAVSSTIITNPLRADHGLYETSLPYDLRDERIGQFTKFPIDRRPETLLASFDDPRPRNIRKAVKEGVKVYSSQDPDVLEFLYQTHHENITSIGGLPKRKDFFYKIPEVLSSDEWRVFVGEINGERVAALLLLYFNGVVEYYTPCVVEAKRSTQALPLLVYESMIDAMARGFHQWNWGGTWLTQDGVYAFKKKWAAVDLRYHYFTRLRDPEIRKCTREELLKDYTGFFVLPFSALAPKSI